MKKTIFVVVIFAVLFTWNLAMTSGEEAAVSQEIHQPFTCDLREKEIISVEWMDKAYCGVYERVPPEKMKILKDLQAFKEKVNGQEVFIVHPFLLASGTYVEIEEKGLVWLNPRSEDANDNDRMLLFWPPNHMVEFRGVTSCLSITPSRTKKVETRKKIPSIESFAYGYPPKEEVITKEFPLIRLACGRNCFVYNCTGKPVVKLEGMDDGAKGKTVKGKKIIKRITTISYGGRKQ
jgi:hypothetical protein